MQPTTVGSTKNAEQTKMLHDNDDGYIMKIPRKKSKSEQKHLINLDIEKQNSTIKQHVGKKNISAHHEEAHSKSTRRRIKLANTTEKIAKKNDSSSIEANNDRKLSKAERRRMKATKLGLDLKAEEHHANANATNVPQKRKLNKAERKRFKSLADDEIAQNSTLTENTNIKPKIGNKTTESSLSIFKIEPTNEKSLNDTKQTANATNAEIQTSLIARKKQQEAEAAARLKAETKAKMKTNKANTANPHVNNATLSNKTNVKNSTYITDYKKLQDIIEHINAEMSNKTELHKNEKKLRKAERKKLKAERKAAAEAEHNATIVSNATHIGNVTTKPNLAINLTISSVLTDKFKASNKTHEAAANMKDNSNTSTEATVKSSGKKINIHPPARLATQPPNKSAMKNSKGQSSQTITGNNEGKL